MENKSYGGPERRKFPRKKERVKIEYVLEDELEKKELNKAKVSFSTDIGGGGIGLYVNEDVDFKGGNNLYIIINLPDKNKMFVFVKVAYIIPTEEKGYKYRVGLHFQDIREDDRKNIINFINRPTGG